MKEFNLSEKFLEWDNWRVYSEVDVREFIKKLKEEINGLYLIKENIVLNCKVKETIDKLAGEKLR